MAVALVEIIRLALSHKPATVGDKGLCSRTSRRDSLICRWNFKMNDCLVVLGV